jgi:hypothetical protein
VCSQLRKRPPASSRVKISSYNSRLRSSGRWWIASRDTTASNLSFPGSFETHSGVARSASTCSQRPALPARFSSAARNIGSEKSTRTHVDPGWVSITRSARPPSPAPRSQKRTILRPPRVIRRRVTSSCCSNIGIRLRRSVTKLVASSSRFQAEPGVAALIQPPVPSPERRRNARRSRLPPPSAG